MGKYTFLVFFAFFFILLDIYAYHGLKSILTSNRVLKVFSYTYLLFSLAAYASAVYLIFAMYNGVPPIRTIIFNLSSGFLFTMFISKLVFASLLFLQDGGRSFVGIFNWVNSSFLSKAPIVENTKIHFYQREEVF